MNCVSPGSCPKRDSVFSLAFFKKQFPRLGRCFISPPEGCSYEVTVVLLEAYVDTLKDWMFLVWSVDYRQFMFTILIVVVMNGVTTKLEEDLAGVSTRHGPVRRVGSVKNTPIIILISFPVCWSGRVTRYGCTDKVVWGNR